MPAVLVPLAVVAFAYLPGWATARWCRARTGRPLVAKGLSPFPEILLGLCLWSWGGFVLAELGVFSLVAIAALLGLYTLAVSLAAGGGRAEPVAGPAVGAALLIAALVGALYWPPYETMVMASDATIHFNAGVHLDRTGSLAVPDPLMDELGLAERAGLFLLAGSEGWIRMAGGIVVNRGGTEVMWPGYSHLLPVWVASFHGLGGLGAAGLVAVTFAALALWAIFLFARETSGVLPAAVTTALVLTNLAELFYGRFLMPEIVAQLFVWGGLLAFVVWWRDDSPAPGALAAFALGLAGLTRVEYLFFPPFALALLVVLGIRWPRVVWPFLVTYLALLLHGGLHLLLVPTHYRDALTLQLALLWERLDTPSTAVWAVLVGATALALRGRWRRAIILLVLLGALAAFLVRPRLPPLTPVPWFAEAVPWPLVVLAALGLAFWVYRCVRGERWLAFPLLLFLVVSGTLLYDPHVTPSLLWGLRRFLPVSIPLLYLFAATALPWRRARWVAAAVAAALLAANALPAVRLRRLPVFPEQKGALRALAEQIPPGAAVFFAPDLADYAIHVPLWLVHERESFVLPLLDPRGALALAARALLPRHPVVYVDEGPATPAVEGLVFTPRGEARFLFVTSTADARTAFEWPLALRLYTVTARGRGGR